MKQTMSAHGVKCNKSVLMCNKNNEKEGILTASYSMMHA